MRASASSRRLPFSTPLVTSGIGMSRCKHQRLARLTCAPPVNAHTCARQHARGRPAPGGPLPHLYAVHSHPRRHHGQDARQQVHQLVGRVVLVQAALPELVQPRAADHQGGVHLEAVRPAAGAGPSSAARLHEGWACPGPASCLWSRCMRHSKRLMRRHVGHRQGAAPT
jgi:hypothetical protein